MAMDEDRIPVIVGVGQINDRPADPVTGHDPVELMALALERAEDDAGARLLADADFLGVIKQISFPDIAEAAPVLAARIGADRAELFQTAGPNGDSPVMLLNQAANRIGAGQSRIVAVAGAEALRTAGARRAANQGNRGDPLRDAAHRVKTGYGQRHGLLAPVDVYPLYENALRAALGQTLAEAQAESGTIWAAMSRVAAANPDAWLQREISAEEVITPSPANRPLAFPYTKLQVANAAVNQGAGFVATSLAEAKRRGIARDRWIHIGNGAAAHEDADWLARDRYDHSAGMAVSIGQAMALNGLHVEDLAAVELYSCFPCIPKLARRVLGWPLDRPVTVVGGLTFGGGPIGNYMSHAIASMADRLRAAGGTGLLFANGGYATHNHSIIISRDPVPAAHFSRTYDFQAEADAARGPVPVLDQAYAGAARVETFTVFHTPEGAPSHGVVVARTSGGARTLAHVADGDAFALLTAPDASPVGMAGTITAAEPLHLWHFS